MRELLRWVARLALLGTGTVAAVHFVYYLYHWEWVRAQVAGTAFVACLVVGVAGVVLGRLDRQERAVLQRLDELGERLRAPAPAAAPQPPAPRAPAPPPVRPPDRSPDLPWLDAAYGPPRTWAFTLLALPALPALAPSAPLTTLPAVPVEPSSGVFIPVLLGAGLALSLVAGAVERVAGLVDRRPGAAAVPATRSPDRSTAVTATNPGAPRGRPSPRRRLLAGLVTAAVVAGAAVAGMWEVAHYRPVALGAGLTGLTVRVDTQTAPAPAEETVDLVARWCTTSAIDGVQVRRVDPVSADTAHLVVAPLLDEQALRRFSGCLEDANLERHRLVVTGSRHLDATAPAAPGPAGDDVLRGGL
ncbi:hypothetical protein [Thalassiella azotivora]